MRSLEAALASPTIPPDIVTTLLNLAEFMEHDEKSLPLDTRCVRRARLAAAHTAPAVMPVCSSLAALWSALRRTCRTPPNGALHVISSGSCTHVCGP